jgi:hypothetical protein
MYAYQAVKQQRLKKNLLPDKARLQSYHNCFTQFVSSINIFPAPQNRN